MSSRLRGIVVELRTNFGELSGVEVELRRGHRIVAATRVRSIGKRQHRVILRANGGVPPAGRYEVEARRNGLLLAQRAVLVRRTRTPAGFTG